MFKVPSMSFNNFGRREPITMLFTLATAIAAMPITLGMTLPNASASTDPMAPVSITLTTGKGVAGGSESVLLTATVVGSESIPTGRIQIKVDGTTALDAPATLNPVDGTADTAVAQVSILAGSIGSNGVRSLTATYSGDATYSTGISPSICQVVGAAVDLNLSSCNFMGADLSSANLQRTNLTGANLTNSNLMGGILLSTNFSSAILADARINGNAMEANFSGADLTGTVFGAGTYLANTSFMNANVSGTDMSLIPRNWLSGAALTGLVGTPSSLPVDWVLSDGVMSYNGADIFQTVPVDGGGGVSVTAYIGPGGAIAIPATIGDQPAVAIADGAFFGFPYIPSISLPSSITSIGIRSFELSSITSLQLPESLRTIGESAFRDAVNVSGTVTFPESVTTIGDYALAGMTATTGFTFLGNSPSIGVGTLSGSGASSISYDSTKTGWPMPTSTFTYGGDILEQLPLRRVIFSNAGTNVLGSPSIASVLQSEYEGLVSLSGAGSLARNGYTFAGWSTSLGGSPVASPYRPVENLTLYPLWSPVVPDASTPPNVEPARTLVPPIESAVVNDSGISPVLPPSVPTVTRKPLGEGVVRVSSAAAQKAKPVRNSEELGRTLTAAPVVDARTKSVIKVTTTGLPRNSSVQTAIKLDGKWVQLGTVKVNDKGFVVLPAFRVTQPGTYSLRLTKPDAKRVYIKVDASNRN